MAGEYGFGEALLKLGCPGCSRGGQPLGLTIGDSGLGLSARRRQGPRGLLTPLRLGRSETAGLVRFPSVLRL